MVGEANRRVQYDVERAEAVAAVETAFGSIGKVLEVQPGTGTVIGRARYGLQSVKLRVSVLDGPRPGTSVLEITGASDDLWGAAARKGTEKLIAALPAPDAA